MAEGAADIAAEPIVALWDLAPLLVIVEEAGGRFTDLAGERHAPTAGSASRPTACCTTRCSPRWRPRAPTESHGTRHGTEVTVGHRHRHVVGEGGRGRRRRQRRRVGRAVPHELQIPAPTGSSTTPTSAWRDGPRRGARARVCDDVDARGVSVAAMVPSLTAVDADGVPLDARAALRRRARPHRRAERAANPAESGELLAFLRWTAAEAPDAGGLLARAGGREPRAERRGGPRHVDRGDRVPAVRLDRRGTPRSPAAGSVHASSSCRASCRRAGTRGRVGGADGPALASGCIDALADQIVAGRRRRRRRPRAARHDAHRVGRHAEPRRRCPGYWVIPHTAAGKLLAGGPSNAGGLFLNWATRARSREPEPARRDPDRVPVWAPYPRGERVPLHDPDRRGRARRSRPHPRRGRGPARRVRGVGLRRAPHARRGARRARRRRRGGSSPPAAGPGSTSGCRRSPTAPALPVDCVAVPEGGALGSACLARIAAGLEEPTAMTDASRWARAGRTVEPDPAWRRTGRRPLRDGS